MMTNEERLAVLETTIISINANLVDIRRQFDVLDKNLEKRFDKIDERFDKVDEKFAKVDERFAKVYEKFDKIENKFDKKFERIDDRFNSVQRQLDQLNHRLWSNFIWIASIILGVTGLIAHAQHWI